MTAGTSENGHNYQNGSPGLKDTSSVPEGWLFICREQSGVLARATEHGLDVAEWSTEFIEKRDIAGKKIMLVFDHVGNRRQDEFDVYGKVRAAGPMLVRIWKPIGLGDEDFPTLKELAQKYDLETLLLADKPWNYDPPPLDEDRRVGWPRTDLGNAERMASRYGGVIRFCRPWKKWLVWNGRYWMQDEIGRVNVMAKWTIRKIWDEVDGAMDKAERESLAKWALSSESSKKIGAMLQLVWAEPRIPIVPAILDPNPWLFNCPNGTIDLRTGALRKHDRSDLITRMSPVEFDPRAICPLWEQTIGRIFADDPELIGFIQRLFGLALTGDVSEQILPIFFGEGGNGKSTILNALLDIMGSDYAIVAPPGLLFAKRQGSHPTDKASLFGMRLVVDLESAEGARLDEAVVKQLTGSDRISARRMREDFWTFLPTHKLILCTNNQPSVGETKSAIWRRLKLVHFAVEIPEEEQKTDLPKRLRDEFPGILAWCVRGCTDWVNSGLRTPRVVQEATAEYRGEEDVLGSFIEDECIFGEGQSLRVRASILYGRFQKVMEGSGRNSCTQQAFGRSLSKRGFKKLVSNGIWYLDIALRDDQPKKKDRDTYESY